MELQHVFVNISRHFRPTANHSFTQRTEHPCEHEYLFPSHTTPVSEPENDTTYAASGSEPNVAVQKKPWHPTQSNPPS